MKQIERFLNQINTQINNDNPEMVKGNVVDHVLIADSNSLKSQDWLTINFKAFFDHTSFTEPNIKAVKYFFNKYDIVIKNYMVIFEESLHFRILFQNDEYYNAVVIKFPSEIELQKPTGELLTVFKF